MKKIAMITVMVLAFFAALHSFAQTQSSVFADPAPIEQGDLLVPAQQTTFRPLAGVGYFKADFLLSRESIVLLTDERGYLEIGLRPGDIEVLQLYTGKPLRISYAAVSRGSGMNDRYLISSLEVISEESYQEKIADKPVIVINNSSNVTVVVNPKPSDPPIMREPIAPRSSIFSMSTEEHCPQ